MKNIEFRKVHNALHIHVVKCSSCTNLLEQDHFSTRNPL